LQRPSHAAKGPVEGSSHRVDSLHSSEAVLSFVRGGGASQNQDIAFNPKRLNGIRPFSTWIGVDDIAPCEYVAFDLVGEFEIGAMPLVGIGATGAIGFAAFGHPLQYGSLAEVLQLIQVVFEFLETLGVFG
jgi:hypothetical protein